MRRYMLLGAILASLAFLTGCGSGPDDYNRACKHHGGVLSTDSYGSIAVCGDHVARGT